MQKELRQKGISLRFLLSYEPRKHSQTKRQNTRKTNT